MGAIGKRESENDVVWITLQARQFRGEKLNITKVKLYGTDTMSVFYDNNYHREKVFKPFTVQDIKKYNISANCCHAPFNPWPNLLW